MYNHREKILITILFYYYIQINIMITIDQLETCKMK